LVALVGASGSGKSTFARSHFLPTEILSSDHFRALVSDDEGDQTASGDAFEILHLVLDKRLRRRKLCVVDATNVRLGDRARLLAKARQYQRPAVAIIFETPESVAIERAANRIGRTVTAEVVRQQLADLNRSSDLIREGFETVFRVTPSDRPEVIKSRSGC
jgi:protein phosphatase